MELQRTSNYINPTRWYAALEGDTETDPVKKDTKEKELQIKYKAKSDTAIKHETLYESNKTKAYSLIWERYSTSTQGQLEQRVDLESDVYKNPIKLLQAIKRTNTTISRHTIKMLDTSLTTFLLTKQRDDEIHEYNWRFKSAKQVLESHLGGSIRLTKYVSQLSIYDKVNDRNNDNLYKNARKQFAAYNF